MKRLVRLIPDPMLTNSRLVFIESVVFLLLLWAVVAQVFDLADTISTPFLVAEETIGILQRDDWMLHVYVTLRRVIFAFIVTIIIGTVLGIAMGLSDFWETALQDYVTLSFALPSLFAVIFAAMWFGATDITPAVASAIITFPYITENLHRAVKNVDSDLFEMSSAYDISRRRVIRRVVFGSVLGEWFAGVRYSFAICWKITTLAELVVAQNGIGYMIGFQMRMLSLTGVMAWAVLFTIIMLVLEYGVLQQIEKRMFRWRTETTIGWA